MAGLLQEIQSRQSQFMEAFNKGNAADAASFYDTECFFMPHGRDPVSGRTAVQAYFEQDMQEGVRSVAMTTQEVNGSGNWAFERGGYALDGKRGPETGSYIQVWRKVSGVWVIHNDCFNVIKPASP